MESPPNRALQRGIRRGLFMNGIWHCDCDVRMPADKFRVKNGGKNHGRWFYTCQKPQPKRCSFFLWSDDAKVREESAVIHNSRTEPQQPQPPVQQTYPPISPPQPSQAPQTPRKQQKIGPLLTPNSKPAPEGGEGTKSKPVNVDDFAEGEDYGWSSSADEELAEVANSVVSRTAAVDDGDGTSPRKAAKNSRDDSPRKRTIAQTLFDTSDSETVRGDNDGDVFMTPSTSTKSDFQNSRRSALLSPVKTPAMSTNNEADLPPSSLASEVLQVLSPVKSLMPPSTERELVDLLNRHDLRTQGIAKGREITRLAIQAKEKRIAELQARISGLEAEKETSRTVIAHLKQDIATSPKKPRRQNHEATRSEV